MRFVIPVAIIVICPLIIFAAFFVKARYKFACTVFGWHLAPHAPKCDGLSFYGKCPRCGTPVIQMSNGEWMQ